MLWETHRCHSLRTIYNFRQLMYGQCGLVPKCMNKITVESGEPGTYTENEIEGTCMRITWEVRTAQELKILVPATNSHCNQACIHQRLCMRLSQRNV